MICVLVLLQKAIPDNVRAPQERPAHCPQLPQQAFQASRVRDAFIASDIEQGVCRTLISLFLPPLTTKPLKPGEGRVWKLEKEESYS
jgi:hypothetical protein